METRRPLLVLSNLLLLLAPHLVYAGDTPTREAEGDRTLQPAPKSHHAPAKVRPQPPSPPRPSPRATTQHARANDDDGGEVASEVASACCAGMIGAMAEPSTPEDVDLPDVPPPEDPPTTYGIGGAPPLGQGSTGSAEGTAFDEDAAGASLDAAERRIHERCGPPEVAQVRVELKFASSGELFDLTFTPKGFTNTPYGKCVEEQVLAVRVPAFDGPPRSMDETLALAPPIP